MTAHRRTLGTGPAPAPAVPAPPRPRPPLAAEPPAGHERQDAAGPPARPGAGPAGQRRALGPGRGRKTAD
ncbi:hypothetical protein [Streptomyces clavuligerus]|uniref:hypothetical protein n=1 Tax=Streptomyces clavuligerus TaxID=1901 RepID=UPI0001800646|nr:hypothetical protein [Streptomyces clavuligerus]EDY53235.1 hypothetical protein SSCG_06272 [Streptomyces clavuligerus]MBY6307896.1 hypothetical protein [Streptomyces clavuligerus]QPJ96939.1 hypothetical protein GE265_27855 [Streptomyces clavuligerus]WDN55710.1 hypothetical protein LL058_27830 [Streptomyces clavuligerus]